jgi:hypothetical protein
VIERIKETSKMTSFELKLVRTINIMIEDLEALKKLMESPKRP